MAREFKLPDLGEGIAEGQIVRVLVKEGESISEDQPLMEVETDKAAVEIPSPFAGKATKIHVKEGQTVEVGQVLVTFEGGGKEDQKASQSEEKTKAQSSRASDEQSEAPRRTQAGRAEAASSGAYGRGDSHDGRGGTATATRDDRGAPRYASGAGRTKAVAAPAVRKFARESGVDLDSIEGSGAGGRVTREDVQAALSAQGAPSAERAAPLRPADRGRAAAPAPMPATRPEIEGVPGNDNWGPIKRQRISQIRKTIANQMVRSVSNIPHVTQTDEADVTELEYLRHELRGEDDSGPRVTLMAFLMRALTVCLREHPQFNSSFDAEHEEMVYKEYINIGVAVDSPRGLVVPVIRDADRLSVLALAQELWMLADKVRQAKFGVEELRGGTFTVTNYGAIGGIWGTPIINYPEVAVLGVGRTQEKLVLDGEELETRYNMPLSLSFDHRAVDGAQAARFLNDVKAHLSHPGLLMIK